MVEQDRVKWEAFREKKRNSLTNKEFEMICQLHAEYLNHTYYKPCTCNPKTIKRWIQDLNEVYALPYAD